MEHFTEYLTFHQSLNLFSKTKNSKNSKSFKLLQVIFLLVYAKLSIEIKDKISKRFINL